MGAVAFWLERALHHHLGGVCLGVFICVTVFFFCSTKVPLWKVGGVAERTLGESWSFLF